MGAFYGIEDKRGFGHFIKKVVQLARPCVNVLSIPAFGALAKNLTKQKCKICHFPMFSWARDELLTTVLIQ